VDLPEEAKRAPPAPVWSQSFPSPKALFVRGTFFIRCYPLVHSRGHSRGTFFIRCYPLVHSRGHSPVRNLGTRVAAVVPQLSSGTATATDTSNRQFENRSSPYFFVFLMQFELRQPVAFVSCPILLFELLLSFVVSSLLYNSCIICYCMCCRQFWYR